MQIKNYNLFVLGLIATLVMLVSIISLLLYNRGPQIRLASFSSDLGKASPKIADTVTLSFDRPIKQQDYSPYISIEPKANIETYTQSQSIVIKFNVSLSSSTDYTLKVEPSITDRTGRKMSTSYTKKFKTPESRYVYLKRNYPITQTAADIEDDHIIMESSGKGSDKILYSAPVIRSFSANSKFVVVVEAGEKNDKLVIVDLETLATETPGQYLDGRISSVSLSKQGEIALITTQPDYQITSAEYFRENSNRLFSLNLINNELKDFSEGNGQSLKATSVKLTNDGQLALIRDENADYYAISPYNDFEPVLLGKHTDDFGFNFNGSEIVFRDMDVINSFDLSTAKLTPRELTGSGYIQNLVYSTDKIMYAKTELKTRSNKLIASSETTIRYAKDWVNNFEIIWKESEKNDSTVYNFMPNSGSNLLSIESSKDNCTFDNVDINSVCEETYTQIYDLNTKQNIKEVRGFDLIWID